MLFGNKKLYKQARAAKLGKSKLSQPLEKLRRSVSEQYEVNVLHIVYDFIDIGPHEGRPRLQIVVETADQYVKIHKDHFTLKPHVKKFICRRFAKLDTSDDDCNEYDTSDVHVTVDNFSDEAMGQAAALFLENDKPNLLKELANDRVWDISGFSKFIVVFYMTDADIQINSTNGTSDRIKYRCYELLKYYDEFDYFDLDTFSIKFDSKQNLDKNYKGSMFYYWR